MDDIAEVIGLRYVDPLRRNRLVESSDSVRNNPLFGPRVPCFSPRTTRVPGRVTACPPEQAQSTSRLLFSRPTSGQPCNFVAER